MSLWIILEKFLVIPNTFNKHILMANNHSSLSIKTSLKKVQKNSEFNEFSQYFLR